ncbi:hypothetical protein HOLleu_08831 [Holothuria leucospilota]|uniref:Uncharacterized protein n=1 Tax=Holothuria leucospilota TaxID=206669 RepID=A0A9Q1CJ97_HOLLE|nr:hypothetical protein HOLleu_08831 [Holothuria leucospilota]
MRNRAPGMHIHGTLPATDRHWVPLGEASLRSISRSGEENQIFVSATSTRSEEWSTLRQILPSIGRPQRQRPPNWGTGLARPPHMTEIKQSRFPHVNSPMTRLDFHNSLLYGLSDLSIKKLQKIQNSAACIVKKKSRRCHTSPLLKELHWLPISDRIKFKILLLTFRSQYLEQPVYISQLLSPYAPPRGLRSSGKALLSLPNPRLKSYGYRCFAYAAPYLWNQLPDHIRFCTDLSAFKRNLKTHFFTCSFECN